MRKNSMVKTLIILFCIAFLMVGMVSHADTLTDLNNEKTQVEQEKADIKEQLEEQKDALEKNQSEMADIIKEQEALTDERDAMLMDIEEIFESIQQLEKTIEETEQDYNNKIQLLKERSLVMYQNSNYSDLQMLLEADNILEYINRKTYFDAMLEKDHKLIDEVLALKADLESKKAIQVENKAAYEKLLAEKETLISRLDDKKGDLSKISESTQQMIANLEAMEDEMAKESENIAEKIRKEQERIRKEKEAEEAAKKKPPTPKPTKKPTPAPSGDLDSPPEENPSEPTLLLWPTNHKSAYISSYFGMRMHPIYNYMRMHNGIDITGWNINGADILAAESGTVLISEWQTNGGYGQYVVIDHGDGLSTVYAHASKLIAKAGQYVERGDVIALVGTTGNSTGPHLHFEVRVDGNPVNPLNYL
ncbi:MAG: hypothetical protein E7388_05215 [Ruminococcaceae bacterium]|nr:hypothetical protein [Oscillospiraceae bacterium]